MPRFRTLALFSLLTFAAAAHAQRGAEVEYLGNEGVMVARGNTKVLFDAFFAESFDGKYSLVPEAIEGPMMSGEAPFDGVDAIFISHIHPDHFNSRKVIAYMRQHPDVRLYAGIDVVGAIRAADASSDPLMQRVTQVRVSPGGPPAHFHAPGLDIDVFLIEHSPGNPAPNHAFRVTLDDAVTVMHFGDADDVDQSFAPYQSAFDGKKINLALPPFWFLMSEAGKRILQQRIRADRTIGIHVDAEEKKHPEQTRKEVGADLLIVPGETRSIP